RAVIHEDAPSVGDEGVEFAAVDDDDLDLLLLQARGLQNRPRIVPQQFLGLGVAQHRNLLSLRERAAGLPEGNGRRRGEHDEVARKAWRRRWPAVTGPASSLAFEHR